MAMPTGGTWKGLTEQGCPTPDVGHTIPGSQGLESSPEEKGEGYLGVSLVCPLPDWGCNVTRRLQFMPPSSLPQQNVLPNCEPSRVKSLPPCCSAALLGCFCCRKEESRERRESGTQDRWNCGALGMERWEDGGFQKTREPFKHQELK